MRHPRIIVASVLALLSGVAHAQDPESVPPAGTAEAAQPPPPAAAGNYTDSGLRVDFKLAGGLNAVSLGSAVLPVGLSVPQLLLGFQSDRLGLLIGLGLFRFSADNNSATSIVVAPTLTYDVARSRDGRAALYLLGSVGIGGQIDSPKSGSGKTQLGIGYQAAAGARYWLSRNLGLGVEAGLNGNFINVDDSANGYSLTLIYGALVASYVHR